MELNGWNELLKKVEQTPRKIKKGFVQVVQGSEKKMCVSNLIKLQKGENKWMILILKE